MVVKSIELQRITDYLLSAFAESVGIVGTAPAGVDGVRLDGLFSDP
jgi:hypothetical protein